MRDIKILERDRKAIVCSDVVNFITSLPNRRIDPLYFLKLKDYRIILTHGVVGEFIEVLNANFIGIDPSKIVLLCNNIEISSFAQSKGVRSFGISEYIFMNEDLYNIPTDIGTGCIFPGRSSKLHGLDISRINVTQYETEPQENMPRIFNKYKCGLMTSETEGSCRAIGEMLLSGLPVISVKIPKKEKYYPEHEDITTYSVVFPNTLGGRELWLDETNSIYCNRNEDSINKAVEQMESKNFDRVSIRKGFIDKLQYNRLQFLYIVKTILSELNIKISVNEYLKFVNLPYSMNTFDNSNWKSIKKSFEYSYEAFNN